MFEIGRNATRVGITMFSTGVEPKIALDDYDDSYTLMEAIGNITQSDGYDTYTDKAIRYMRVEMFGRYHRDNVAKIGIVITDGQSANVLKTSIEAARIKRKGVTMFSIGIGNKIDRIELMRMASRPWTEHMFNISSFGALQKIKRDLAVKTCEGIFLYMLNMDNVFW